jgi:hypothetical protein
MAQKGVCASAICSPSSALPRDNSLAEEIRTGGDHPIEDSALVKAVQGVRISYADDAVDGHGPFHEIAVLVEVDVPEDAVLDGRPAQLSRYRRARAVGAGDRVQQDLGRLGGVRGGVRRARLACSGGFELLQKPLARGWELAVRHAVDADVHPSRRRPGGLEQIRDGTEAVGGDERHVGTEAGAEIPNQAAPVRIQEAADDDRVGTSQGDASGEALAGAAARREGLGQKSQLGAALAPWG